MMNPTKILITLVLSSFLLGFTSSVFGHQTSTGYFTGELDSTGAINGQLQLRLFDLEQTVGLDQDRNGELTWGEVLSQVDEVERYVEESLQFKRQQQHCPISFAGDWQVDSHFDDSYLLLPIKAQCALEGDLEIDYSSIFAYDSDHKLLFSLSTPQQSFSRVISDTSQSLTLDTQKGSVWATFKEFTKQGAIHIWIGLDHILFLMCLLLASVFRLSPAKSTKNIASVRDTGIQILTLVTAFTLAHSVTLAAVALNWIQVSSTWVEVGIAISVFAAALNNIFPLVKRLTLIIFGFGLLHGMGFAGVLGELGLPSDQKLLTVLAFNLGVEFGQLVIILAIIPFMLLINKYNLRPRSWLIGGSVTIALISLVWIIERLPF